MRKIFFRVDASVEIGYGHIARCICLAEYCIERSVDCLFVVKNSDEKVQAMLQQYKLDYTVINDESFILEIDKESPQRIVVLDVHNPVLFPVAADYHSYVSLLQENGFAVAAFEEMTGEAFLSDLVIIPYVGADKKGYTDTADIKYLLGPAYFIFRKEFLPAPKVVVRDAVKNIFICMGGSDPARLVEKIIGWLVAIPVAYNLSIVFARLDGERRSSIEKILRDYPGNWRIIIDPPLISSVIAASDIGIINSGLIKYETSVLGLPCITVSNEEAHEPLMNLFAENESIFHLGLASELTEKEFGEAITRMTADSGMRKQISQKCIAMFDGKGIERIYTNLLQLKN